ncbi:hypothetical protein O181_085849 [Austropuccinia psidii MF-1]|uniref:Uncharacterized protein n=1 Tax=Austropuccinia psidii MF-1 TaxID=1389203 RepID=A0A9Q3FVV8_9BASI|nr:hypothetical protein [Austropuccinia psidii MF-1]
MRAPKDSREAVVVLIDGGVGSSERDVPDVGDDVDVHLSAGRRWRRSTGFFYSGSIIGATTHVCCGEISDNHCEAGE